MRKKIEVRYYKKYIDKIVVLENATFPVNIDDIEEWETSNNMKINIFSLDDDNLRIEYNRQKKNKNIVNLLLYQNHYVWLKSLDRFYASKSSKHSKYRCMHCLDKVFNTQKKLEKHFNDCIERETFVTDEELPEEG